MTTEIVPIPPLPKAIADAVNNKSLAVLIGAGVSRLVGCVGWDDLAKNLVKRCNVEELINYKERESLLQNSDHKKTITICHHLLESNTKKEMFYDEMRNALREGADVKIPNIYDEIYKLRGLFLTTNADTHFDRLFLPPKVLYKTSDFDKENIDQTNLYHIHGSIASEGSVVFTLKQYFQRYRTQSFRDFLHRIFSEYTVLFLGYGMAEFELIDFVLQNFDTGKQKELKHYMLSSFYHGEENMLKFEQAYYSQMGITVQAYEMDDKGYYQLHDVISSWNREINQVTKYQHETYKEIEKALGL